ncbi:hypothetical protein DEU56DRAFT_752389 [Suillus clintonianus]|uniref:uncharacterized protein n=1 Tax=Suillus clintonianus TaxID=1904413 RepID=UPI001B86D9DD|nr:uncharacterized protein DEU56DRAFT_752389 [Suillus clintonianus]KAG2151493.1 hypothetical protein DEU56DRAFT_752389 [Suillus clintonianus]
MLQLKSTSERTCPSRRLGITCSGASALLAKLQYFEKPDDFVTTSSSLDWGNDIPKEPTHTCDYKPHREVDTQVSNLPDDEEPAQPYARVFFTRVCSTTLVRPNHEQVWKEVSQGLYNLNLIVCGFIACLGVNLMDYWSSIAGACALALFLDAVFKSDVRAISRGLPDHV